MGFNIHVRDENDLYTGQGSDRAKELGAVRRESNRRVGEKIGIQRTTSID
jgi:hypothetical protein